MLNELLIIAGIVCGMIGFRILLPGWVRVLIYCLIEFSVAFFWDIESWFIKLGVMTALFVFFLFIEWIGGGGGGRGSSGSSHMYHGGSSWDSGGGSGDCGGGGD